MLQSLTEIDELHGYGRNYKECSELHHAEMNLMGDENEVNFNFICVCLTHHGLYVL